MGPPFCLGNEKRVGRLLFVQGGANRDGVGRIHGTAAFFHVLNLAFFIHNKRGAIGELHFLVEDAVILGDLAGHIGKKLVGNAQFFGEFLVRRRGVNADAKYSRIIQINLAIGDTSLVRLEFRRSTTGKGQHIKRQDHILLAAKIRELDLFAVVAAHGEIRSHVSDLQVGMGDSSLRLLGRRGLLS